MTSRPPGPEASRPLSRSVVILRSNPVDPDPRVEKAARALARAGWKVVVVGWDRTGSLPGTRADEWGRTDRLGPRAAFGRGLANAPATFRWQLRLWGWLARRRAEYTHIHACDFDTVLPAVLAKSMWGKVLVYDIFDFYADQFRRTPGWVRALVRRIDRWAVGRADAVILVDDARRVQIEGTRHRRVEIVYNTPEDSLAALDRRPPPPRAGLRLAYVGLLQVERGLAQWIAIVGRHPEWTLDLAGFGGDEPLLRSLAQAHPNVRFHGRIPYARGLELMHGADVLTAIYDPGIANHRLASPNKLFEAMMLGRPVIVARGTNVDRLVESHKCGLVLTYGDEGALEAALLELAANPGKRRKLGQAGRQAYLSTYSWTMMEKRLAGLYDSV